MSVTKTETSTEIFGVSDGIGMEYFAVGLKGNMITDIKMPHQLLEVDPKQVTARLLWMLKLLMAQLEKDGYTLAYKPTEAKQK